MGSYYKIYTIGAIRRPLGHGEDMAKTWRSQGGGVIFRRKNFLNTPPPRIWAELVRNLDGIFVYSSIVEPFIIPVQYILMLTNILMLHVATPNLHVSTSRGGGQCSVTRHYSKMKINAS